jgi:hypothetical protein
MIAVDLPLYALIGIISMVTGAGGAWGVTRKQAKDNENDIAALKHELAAHTRADAVAFNEIMRSLGRIEGTLQELKRGN